MKTILSINASFEVRGGADRFFAELNRLMLDKGERVVAFTFRPELPPGDLRPNEARYFIDKGLYPRSILKKIAGGIGVFHAPRIFKDLESVIEREKPSVAHIHNIYHRIPYCIVDILKKRGIKTVWWLHDYKWICPNHQLYTGDRLCKRCKTGNYFNAIAYHCQNNSVLKSTIACCFAYYVSLRNYRNTIDRFIAPSQSVYELFKEFGFPVSKMKVLPHFNYQADNNTEDERRAAERSGKLYVLYVGRIEKNKGLFHCAQALGASGYPLKVIGTGNYEIELRKFCDANGFSNIELIGWIAPVKLPCYYNNALFVVVPSVWYEVFGLTIVESFKYAKPVVAADIGAISEIVDNGKTGLLYRPGDVEDLTKKVRWMFDNQESARQMGLAAREYALQRFSPDNYWKELKSLHASLRGEKSDADRY